MTQVHSFPPIAAPSARTLILGTMPGKASLQAGRYYSHPRNSFWPILGAVLGFDPSLPYEDRIGALCSRGIALWDVLQLCTRETSLDSDIDEASIVPNDFALFLSLHPELDRICFNGAKAAEIYRRHVALKLTLPGRDLKHIVLPSTSPANAGIPYAEKLHAWAAAVA